MSKSISRKKSHVVNLRCSPEELSEIKTKAERAGLCVSAFLREVVLDAPPPRQQARPPVEKILLSRILSRLGRTNVNNNTTQIYDHLNSYALSLNRGKELEIATTQKLIKQTHTEIKTIRELLLRALGRV